MKVLEKTVTLGEMEFKIGTNRDIAIKTFEEFPLLAKKMSEVDATEIEEQDDGVSEFVKFAEKKELSTLYELHDLIGDAVAFALPLMLEVAGDKSDANEIIEYATENNAIKTFNVGIWDFLMQGLPQVDQKPKIKFSMK